MMWPYTFTLKHYYYANETIRVYSQLRTAEMEIEIANNPLLHNHLLCSLLYWPEWDILQCSLGSYFVERVKNYDPWERAKKHLALFVGTVVLGFMIVCFGIIGKLQTLPHVNIFQILD